MTTTETFLDRFNFHTKELSHISTGGYLRECKECVSAIGEEVFGTSDDPDVVYGEPYFSWSACDTCGSTLGGDREVGHAIYQIDPILGEGMLHLSCCMDCVFYLANGDLSAEE